VNVVDSSAWLEYFGDGENAVHFAPAIESPADLVVPSLTLHEVFKRTCQIADEATAFEAAGVMLQGMVIDLTPELALEAARVSLDSGLAMAGSILLATARHVGATLWTQDARFEGMGGVEFRVKPGSAG
jgi:predicted nucleic acid-binding protein